MSSSPLHIVLIEPEIPQNTGNIGRTCVGLSAPLHIVGKTGFSLTQKEIKRSGLDYWDKLQLHQHKSWDDFVKTTAPSSTLLFLSTKGAKTIWESSYQAPLYLIFGSESRGLPPSFYERYRSHLVKIPMSSDIRSLNLATSVGVAAYEAARKLGAL